MARRPRLLKTAAAVIALVAGCAPARVASTPPAAVPVRHPPAASSPAQGAASDGPATTTPLAGDGPAATAARFALAYLDSPPGDDPEKRRQRCRPFDTGDLDALLAAPAWAGANNLPGDQGSVAVIDAINPVDSDDQGVGYELAITTTSIPTGRRAGIERLDVQLWVSATIDGWRVSQVSVT